MSQVVALAVLAWIALAAALIAVYRLSHRPPPPVV